MNKKINYLLMVSVISIFGLISCSVDSSGDLFIPGDDNTNQKLTCDAIIISETQYNLAETDEYTLNGADIASDSLMIEVQYGGGCGPESFELITNGLFMESNPVQLNVILAFDSDDPCEMLVTRKLCFDLSNLAEHYNDSYQTNEGTIILHIQDLNNLTYNF
jgi:hypothetical protein